MSPLTPTWWWVHLVASYQLESWHPNQSAASTKLGDTVDKRIRTIRVEVVVVVLGDARMRTGVYLSLGPPVLSGTHARLSKPTQKHLLAHAFVNEATQQWMTKHCSKMWAAALMLHATEWAQVLCCWSIRRSDRPTTERTNKQTHKDVHTCAPTHTHTQTRLAHGMGKHDIWLLWFGQQGKCHKGFEMMSGSSKIVHKHTNTCIRIFIYKNMFILFPPTLSLLSLFIYI